MNQTTIHTSLVGSRSHGLHNDESDYDYRSIYVIPTKQILSLNFKYKGTHWTEGVVDNTAYEIQHFLTLATKANPSILEIITRDHNTFTSDYSEELLNLFPYLYNPKDAFNAYTGYSYNQRKKFLENKENRSLKYAVAYIRTLFNLQSLLQNNSFNLAVTKENKIILNKIKNNLLTNGDIIDLAYSLVETSKTLLTKATNQQDLDKVNKFLLKIRKNF